jgi:hypothetical protein
MLNLLPSERLLFAEEEGADVSPGGGGASVAESGGDYDFGDLGEVDLFGGNADDELVDEDEPKDEPEPASGDVDSDDLEPEEVAPATESQGFDDALLDRAAAIGFNYNDVKEFGSNRLLEVAVNRAERLARNILEQHQRSSSQSDASRSPQRSGSPSKAELAHAEQEERIAKLADEGWGDDTVAIMRSQNDMVLQQARVIEQLQQQSIQSQNALAVASQQEAEVRFERSMDGYLETLGDEYSSLFGKGASAELQQGTQEFANRARVFQVASAMKEMAQQKGWEVPSDSRAFEMAVNAEFGSHAKELARKEIKSKLRQSGKSATSRPSQSVGKALTGVEKAASRVSDFFKTHGVPDEGFDDDI